MCCFLCLGDSPSKSPPRNRRGIRWFRGAAMTIDEKLEKIEAMLLILVERQKVREWYSVDEFAQTVGRSEFTCREWCRNGRIHAKKKVSGRGAHTAWAISHEELERYQREGLLRSRETALHVV